MESRLEKAKQNIFWAAVNKAVGIILPFLVRTVLIYRLGAAYLGLGSLFTSVLQVLNLAELGFGAAIVYELYRPMAEGDDTKVCALLSCFRWVYRIVGTAVLIIGIALLPALKYLIHGSAPADINLYILYLIYLGQAVSSYWFTAYRQCLLNASQKVSVIMEVTAAIRLTAGLVQIAVLLCFSNFYVYSVILPAGTILQNLILGRMVSRMYPQYVCRGMPDPAIRADLGKRVTGLFISRLGSIGVYSSDSIVISAFLGLTALGIFENYLLIVNALHAITGMLLTSVQAGIGNSLAVETKEKNYHDMQAFQLLYMWMGIWFTVCLVCMIQPFMKLWLGSSMMFSETESIICCIYFYTHIMNDICYIYRVSAGLWWEERYRAITAGLFNLVMNILLVRWFGVTGVMAATILYQILMDALWGTRILYKNTFPGFSRFSYLLKLIFYAVMAAALCVLCRFFCGMLPDSTGITAWAVLIGKGILCSAAALFCGILFFRKLPEYGRAMEVVRRMMPIS